MSLEQAELFEREYIDSTLTQTPIIEQQTPEQPQNVSTYLYATTIFLPLIIASLCIIGIPTDPESKSGKFLKIISVILIIFSVMAMYLYYKKIDFMSYFKPNNQEIVS